MSDQATTAKAPKQKGDKWWQSMLWAAGIAAAGIYMFTVFDNLEKNGGTVRMNWLFVLIYNSLGKWGVLIVCLVLGAGMLAFGVKELIDSRKAAAVSP